MAAQDEQEDERLRTVALQNAQAILPRLETEEALRVQTEWQRVMLASIGTRWSVPMPMGGSRS